MRVTRVTRFIADCGKGFWKRTACLTHDENCKCWTNPKNKACRTCKHGSYAPYENDTGGGGYWECNNDSNTNDEHVNDLMKVDYISVNCKFWEGKK